MSSEPSSSRKFSTSDPRPLVVALLLLACAAVFIAASPYLAAFLMVLL